MPRAPIRPLGEGQPVPIEWTVERFGSYVLLKVSGQQTTAILPLKAEQAREMTRQMKLVLREIERKA
jgi:hypothetical protein